MIIDKEYAERLSHGSQILGFGGGGSAEEGLLMCEAAFEIAEKNGHSIELISIEELAARHPKGGKIVTISGVGSPAADTAYTPSDYYPRLMELLEKEGYRDIIGFISCEIGASSSFEPFLPAAMLGVPVIDAPCDGRAHPLGLMGALTLEKRGFSVLQVCVGGRKGSEGTRAEDKNAGQYVELSVRGSVESASALVRNAASAAGGAVSVARNPADLSWIEDNGAKGAYAQAEEIGTLWKQLIAQDVSLKKAALTLADCLHGKMLGIGVLKQYSCITENVLDHGEIQIRSADAQTFTLTFFNEYMTLEEDSARRYTFPDGIVIIGEDLKIYSSAVLSAMKGSTFAVVATNHDNLIIPPALRNRSHYLTVEEVIRKDLISHLDCDGFFID